MAVISQSLTSIRRSYRYNASMKICRIFQKMIPISLFMALTGCTVISAIDTAASVTIDAVGSVVKAVIP